jgi:hypothetical protein
MAKGERKRNRSHLNRIVPYDCLFVCLLTKQNTEVMSNAFVNLTEKITAGGLV